MLLKMYRKSFELSSQLLKPLPSSNQPLLFQMVLNNQLSKRWAGHSKWQNIKSTKEAADQMRSTVFTRINRQIILAIKEGGEDPSVNIKLKNLLAEATKANMPKQTIEKAFTQAKTQKSNKPYWVVFSGPGGIVLGFEVTFANKKPNYLIMKFQPVVKKLNMKFEAYYDALCKDTGVILADPLPNVQNSYEKALDDGIETGVEEVYENDDKTLVFECLSDRVDSISKKLSERGYNIISASTELDFKQYINLSKEEIELLESQINKIQSQNEEVLRSSYNVMS